MSVVSLAIFVMSIFCIVIGIVVLVNLINDSRPKINKVAAPWRDPMNNPHYRKAMEELDEIDITLGIMDPKPKPRQRIKAPHQLTTKAIPETLTPAALTAAQRQKEIQDFQKIKELREHMATGAQSKYQKHLIEESQCMSCNKPGIHTHVIPAIQTEIARK